MSEVVIALGNAHARLEAVIQSTYRGRRPRDLGDRAEGLASDVVSLVEALANEGYRPHTVHGPISFAREVIDGADGGWSQLTELVSGNHTVPRLSDGDDAQDDDLYVAREILVLVENGVPIRDAVEIARSAPRPRDLGSLIEAPNVARYFRQLGFTGDVVESSLERLRAWSANWRVAVQNAIDHDAVRSLRRLLRDAKTATGILILLEADGAVEPVGLLGAASQVSAIVWEVAGGLLEASEAYDDSIAADVNNPYDDDRSET